MKNVKVFVSIVLILCFVVGCTQSSTLGIGLDRPTATSVNTPTIKASPTEIATSTVTPTKTPTPIYTEPVKRVPISLEDVKNINPSYIINLDESGSMQGLPDYISKDKENWIKACYLAIKEKYVVSTVYFDVNRETEQYVFNVIMGGTLFYQITVNDNGEEVYSDYPISFEVLDTNCKLSGVYRPVRIPADSIGVIWKNGLPQLLSNYIKLPNGDSYFTHYMKYSDPYSYGAYPWEEVSGVSEILATFPAIEDDLVPIAVQNTAYEYMGVTIKSKLIVDESALPTLHKVMIPDQVYAEYIARVLFSVWWYKGNEVHDISPSEADFDDFMKKWSQAQRSGSFDDWNKVQINNIWANDLRDGFGYQQKPYDVWPMYAGDTPEGVEPMEEFSIVLVCGNRDKYITLYGTFFSGHGTNKDTKKWYIYQYYYDYSLHNVAGVIVDYLSLVDGWLVANRGEEIESPPFLSFQCLNKLLSSSGVSVQ